MSEPGKIVLTVGVYEGECRRQPLARLMMIEHDDVETELDRLRKGVAARGAAVNGDQEARATGGNAAHSLDVGAVALEQAIRNVKEQIGRASCREGLEI